MTEDLAQEASKRSSGRVASPRMVALARAVIFTERAAPLMLMTSAPWALIVSISLLGFWSHISRIPHALALILAIAASIYLFFRERRRRRRARLLPTRAEALARLERDGHIRHDALQTQEDRPLGAGALWDAHVLEMREEAARARINRPRASADDVDPHRLRYAGLAALLISALVAGDQAGNRLADGLWPKDPRAAKAGFADLWIEPPAYTGKAPIYLLRAKDSLPGSRAQIDAPAGSLVHAQVKTGARFALTLQTPEGRQKGVVDGSKKSARRTLVLGESGVLTLSAGGRTGRWPIGVIADEKPSVDFIEPPRADSDGRLVISVRTVDDYGVKEAFLELRLAPDQSRPVDAAPIEDGAKGEVERVALDALTGGAGAKSVAVDLLSHRWAGLQVSGRIIVSDAAGQEGTSVPEEFTLPEKTFVNPLAETVIEQRQSLALAPGEWRRVAWALNGITLAPQYFFDDTTNYLLLRTAMWRVSKVAGGDYKNTVDEFWPLALQLEDETLELARRRLDAAKDALKDALERGASPEEIAKLTEAMRAALQQYLQALAQSGAKSGDAGQQADDVVNSSDLDAMLDSIRDLAQSGAENAARQALAELENLLNNLQAPSRGGASANAQGQGQGGPAGEAGDLIGRQRELADKTFERGETKGAQGGDLATEQGEIAGDLSALMKALGDAAGNEGEGENPDPDGKAGQSLSRALSEMGESERALKEGNFDGAGDAMERAIASLREGAKTLARNQAGGQKNAGGQPQLIRDPLGRPLSRSNGSDVEVPEKSDAQRARELLLELRRRLSNGERTEEEIKYLERLLERF